MSGWEFVKAIKDCGLAEHGFERLERGFKENKRFLIAPKIVRKPSASGGLTPVFYTPRQYAFVW